MLKIFKKILKKEKKKKEEEEKGEIIGTCSICNQPVYEKDEYKKLSFQGQEYIFHLKCFRKAKKIARRFASKGIIPKL